jgi:hypothetical protein
MTTTRDRTYKEILDSGHLGYIEASLAAAKLGTQMAEVKVVVSGLTAAGTHDITTAAFKALATITGIELLSGENLPPIGDVRSLRVTAATTVTTEGSYQVTDASGTAVTANSSAVLGIATLTDDGKTLGFPTADVTAFVLRYRPRTAVAMSAAPSNFPSP